MARASAKGQRHHGLVKPPVRTHQCERESAHPE